MDCPHRDALAKVSQAQAASSSEDQTFNRFLQASYDEMLVGATAENTEETPQVTQKPSL